MFRTCPFLFIAVASKLANVRRAVRRFPKAEPGQHQTLETSIILLDNVIEKLGLAQPRETPDLAGVIHFGHGSRIDQVLIDRDGTY
jgi:hypothetical protein